MALAVAIAIVLPIDVFTAMIVVLLFILFLGLSLNFCMRIIVNTGTALPTSHMATQATQAYSLVMLILYFCCSFSLKGLPSDTAMPSYPDSCRRLLPFSSFNFHPV